MNSDGGWRPAVFLSVNPGIKKGAAKLPHLEKTNVVNRPLLVGRAEFRFAGDKAFATLSGGGFGRATFLGRLPNRGFFPARFAFGSFHDSLFGHFSFSHFPLDDVPLGH